MDELTRKDFIEANNAGKLDMFEETFYNMIELATSVKLLKAEIARLTTSNEYANNLLDEQRAHINNQSLKISALTAGSEAMQEDARNNTATINRLMAQLAEVNEENRGLRQMLHMEPR